jgi:hypothetical protein
MLHIESPPSVAAATFGATVPLSSATRAKTGGKGIRTPGLLIANETLYQLSYTPILPMNRIQINPIKISVVYPFCTKMLKLAVAADSIISPG